MRKIIKSGISVFLLVAILITPVAAQNYVISVPSVVQSYEMWCWAACIESCVKKYNSNSAITQAATVQLVYGNMNPTQGADVVGISTGLSWWGLSSVWREEAAVYSRVNSEAALGRPTIIQFKYSTLGHVVVGTGTITGGSGALYVGYMDPASGTLKTSVAGNSGRSAILYDGIPFTLTSHGVFTNVQ